MRLIHNVYSGEQLDLKKDVAIGISGILIKGGQGEWPDFPRVRPDITKEIEAVGLPWGVTWQFDARYSPEKHKAAIKTCYPTGNFGKLGLWLCVEYPFYNQWMNELTYWLLPYAKYTNVESIWRGVYNYTGVYPGIYTSISKWRLIFGDYPQTNSRKCPNSLQEEIAKKSELMTAQYGVSKPDPYGAWKGNYALWQWREGPDYSYCTDEWFDKKIGVITPEPEPDPEPEQMPIKSITVHLRAEGKVELVWAKVNDFYVNDKVKIELEPYPGDPPTPVPGIVDDIQYGVLRYIPIDNGMTDVGKFTPAVVQLNDRPIPDGRKGDPIPVHKSCWDFMDGLNNDAGDKYMELVGKMWINRSYSDKYTDAKAESIGCMCNVVSWEKGTEKNNCYKIRCFQSTDNFQTFNPEKINWFMHPELFFKAQSVNDKGEWMKVLKGIDCYIPLMACSIKDGGTGELWLAMNEVEPFPQLPIIVTVTAEIGLLCRELPAIDSKQTGSYLKDDRIKILEYAPRGNMIWGRTIKGWCCLRYLDGSFNTTWVLETPRVLPPDN